MKSFSKSGLHSGIVKVLTEKQINIPSDIQSQTIPILLNHKGDFVGRSATGTGKTIAFGGPLLSKLNVSDGKTQAVVLVPTRELCEQIGNELIALSKYIEGLKIKAIYGGVSLKSQKKDISNGVQLIVATPGRLIDLIQRNIVQLTSLKYIILDEADEMLLKGFRTDIDKILTTTDRQYSTWLFSATMPSEIKGIIKKYLNKDLKKVYIDKSVKTNEDIEHQIIEVNAEAKLNVLLHFLTRFDQQKGIIFCRTKSGVQKLFKQLSANKFSCGAIHGDLPQGLRNKVMDQYREGHINLLIATDVASRGIDVQDLNYVLQYHHPDTADAYTHRSGRTSRAGNKGISITFVFPEEMEKMILIKNQLKINFKKLELPSDKDQLINKAIIWGRKIAKQKPLGDKLQNEDKQDFKNELLHLSKDELLEKLLATYLREQQN